MLASKEEGAAPDAQRFSLASDIVELVVLTGDDTFLHILREAVGATRRLWHVPTADKVSDLLVAGEVGILVLDVQALNEPASEFVGQIKRQFPDLVVVAAGTRDTENALAGLISSGMIYRFIHKPMSPGRARLFADAAVKRFEEQRRRAAAAPSVKRLSRPNRRLMLYAALAAVGVLAVALAIGAFHGSAPPGAGAPQPGESPQADAAPQADLAPQAAGSVPATGAASPGGIASPGGSTPTAGTAPTDGISRVGGIPQTAALGHPSTAESALLDRAAAALAANRLTAPPGDNALELYLQAQARDPMEPKARAGLSEVHERLLARAENALLEEKLDEASAAIETARRSGVESGRIAFLTAQLAKSREQTKSAQTKADAGHETKASDVPVGNSGGASIAISSIAVSSGAVSSGAVADNATPPRPSAAALNAIEPPKDPGTIGAASPNAEPARRDNDAASARRQFLSDVVASGNLELVKSVKPVYPAKAELNRVTGWIELDFTVAEDGAVKDIAVHASSSPGVFDAAAMGALSQWRYKPVLRDSKAVAQRARIRIRFALAD